MTSLLCDRVLRQFDGSADRRLDHLDLRWDECHRRASAKTTGSGRPVRLLLRLGVVLRDGDVIADTVDCLLVVRVMPCQVLVVRPTSPHEAALTTLELGNLHVPVEVGETEILTPADGPAMGVLTRRSIVYSVEERLFQPTAISGVTWNIVGDGTGLTINSPAKTLTLSSSGPSDRIPLATVPDDSRLQRRRIGGEDTRDGKERRRTNTQPPA